MKKLIFFIFLIPMVSAEVNFAETIKPLLNLGIWGIAIAIILFVILVIGGSVIWWQWQRKKWYLQVLLKMPREGGRTINSEVAKGFWDARKATLWVKRKGAFGKKFFVQLDDIRKYLHGNETVELMGSGIIWKPILFESYLNIIDSNTGQEANIMTYSMDFTKDKAWAISAERDYTSTFSLSDVFNKLKDYIGWGLVIAIVILAEVVRVAYVGKT